jgi:hypothetical protein
MANIVRLKSSQTGSATPTVGSGFTIGEIAVNTNDGKLFVAQKTAGSVGDNSTAAKWVGAPILDEDAMASDSATSLATQQSIKKYVDDSIVASESGLDWKDSVRVVATSDITLGGTPTIDGITVEAGDRVLAQNQDDDEDNGIYSVNASLGWPRATDADADAEFTGGLAVFVEEGTNYGDSAWVCTNNGTVDVGSDDIAFTQFTGLGRISAGDGLTKTGNTLNVVGSTGITANADNLTTNDGEIVHDNLSGFVANEHIDWTANGAGTIHSSNYTDTNTTYSAATSSALGLMKLEDDTEQSVAANSVTTVSGRTYGVQFNASDQAVVNVPWANTTYTSSDFTHDNLSGVDASEHIDWTADQGATNIHSGNYTDTNTTYSAATSSALGLVKLEDDTEQSVAANAVSATAGRTYGVQLNSSDQAVVNVPWSDSNQNTSWSLTDGTSSALIVHGKVVKFTGSGVSGISGAGTSGDPYLFTFTDTANTDTIDMGDGFVIEDDGGTEVTITENKEMKIIGEGGLTTAWSDTSTGSDADPYDLTLTIGTLNQNTTGTAAGLSSTLAVGSGGTGVTSFTDNGILYGDGSNALDVTAAGTDGYFLYSNSGTPSWTNVFDGGTF